MPRTFFFLACFFACFQLSHAQFYLKMLGHSADTVYPKLSGATGKEKMHLYNQLAFYHSISDADSGIYYADLALKLSEKYDDPYEKGYALRNIGNASALAGNYRDAVIHLQRSLDIYEGLDDPRKKVEIYFDLAKLNYDLEDYENSLAYAARFWEIIQEQDLRGDTIVSTMERAMILGSRAVLERERENYEQAVTYFKEYIQWSENVPVPNPIHTAMINSLGETYTSSGELDSAMKYFYLARSLYSQNRDKPWAEHTGNEGYIARIILDQGDTIEAMSLFKESYLEELTEENYHPAARTATYIGSLYFRMGRLDSSIYWYNQALNLAEVLHGQINADNTSEESPIVYSGYQKMMNLGQSEIFQRYYRLMTDISFQLYRYYKKTNQPHKALVFHEKRYDYNDSLNQVTTNLEEKRTQTRFESERMEQQLLLMEQETELARTGIRQTRLFLFGISGILVAVILMILLYLRQNRLKADQERIILQQKLFRSQMNPHFLYNSLASIQNFIITEDPDNASIYLSRFSSLVRNILDSSAEEFVPMEKEIELIKNYLSLQKVRYAEKMDYSIEVDDSLDAENMLMPPMLAQPFIENAIEHGIRHKKGKGHVIVRFRRLHDCTIFEVEDDGMGREFVHDLQLKQQGIPGHRSMATGITRQRIAALNKKHRMNITLEIIDLKDENGQASGTLVWFRIPMG